MAKGWIKINTVNDIESNTNREIKAKKNKEFNSLMKKTKTLSVEKLKERCEISYINQQIEENNLLDAFEHKKLKSKSAIKRALQLKKERAKLEKKSKPTEQQKHTDSTNTTEVKEESKESNV